LPIENCGLRHGPLDINESRGPCLKLDDEAVRVAVGARHNSGVVVLTWTLMNVMPGFAEKCLVELLGLHHALNDIVWWSLKYSAGIPATIELSRHLS